jgi:hypothetical protein
MPNKLFDGVFFAGAGLGRANLGDDSGFMRSRKLLRNDVGGESIDDGESWTEDDDDDVSAKEALGSIS